MGVASKDVASKDVDRTTNWLHEEVIDFIDLSTVNHQYVRDLNITIKSYIYIYI